MDAEEEPQWCFWCPHKVADFIAFDHSGTAPHCCASPRTIEPSCGDRSASTVLPTLTRRARCSRC